MINLKSYCVYMHKNKINQKVYIGQTCQPPERRWKKGQGYKNCTHFYYAIQKYGWDNFEHIIIKQQLTLEQANKLEKALIKKYDAINNGYNIRVGGHDAPDNHREVICLNTGEIFESLADASEKYLKNRYSDSGKISRACKTKGCHAGKVGNEWLSWAYLDEYLENPQSFQNYSVKKKGHTDRKILCVTTGQVFNQIQEAVAWCGQKGNANIIKVCKGERKTSGKHPQTGQPLVWKYI